MFIRNRYLIECNPDMLLAVEQRVERFETAWRDGRHPNLPDFLPAGGIERRATLLELVHTDLECRLKAGESARAEEYLQQYPELRDEQSAMLELIEVESRLGRRCQGRCEQASAPAGTNRRLSKFELLEELGCGAFGTVYRAAIPRWIESWPSRFRAAAWTAGKSWIAFSARRTVRRRCGIRVSLLFTRRARARGAVIW